MKIINTRLIYLNGERRIVLIFDESDFKLLLFLTNLPECTYSQTIRNWHIKSFDNYINVLNHFSPDNLLFLDLTPDLITRFEEEAKPDKKVSIHYHFKNGELKIKSSKYLNSSELMIISNFSEVLKKSEHLSKNNIQYDLQAFLNNLKQMGYNIFIKKEEVVSGIRETLSGENYHLIKKFKKLMKENSYSNRTIEAYTRNIYRFLDHCGTGSDIDSSIIKSYIDEMGINGQLSRSSLNQLINSIKIYFTLVHGRKLGKNDLPRPRRRHRKPEILTKNEVGLLEKSITNPKHRTMIKLIYKTGIKPSELLELKPEDLDFMNKNILIRGNTDKNKRKVPMTSQVESVLRSYIDHYLPKNFLFEKINGSAYSVRNLQKIFQTALLKTHVDKRASIYTLRYSYAIHQFEIGTNTNTLQQILGHSSRKTTEMYSYLIKNFNRAHQQTNSSYIY